MTTHRAASWPSPAAASSAVETIPVHSRFPSQKNRAAFPAPICYAPAHEPVARQPTQGRATCPAHVRARHSRSRSRRTLRARLRTRRTKSQQDLLLRLSPPQTIRHRNQMPARTIAGHEPIFRPPRAVRSPRRKEQRHRQRATTGARKNPTTKTTKITPTKIKNGRRQTPPLRHQGLAGESGRRLIRANEKQSSHTSKIAHAQQGDLKKTSHLHITSHPDIVVPTKTRSRSPREMRPSAPATSS